eukprot:gene31545-38126_t
MRRLFVIFCLLFASALGLEWDKVSQKAFDACDVDKNSSLDQQEFGACVVSYLRDPADDQKTEENPSNLLHASKEDLNKLYSLVDLNHDGEVDLEEYSKMFTRAKHPSKAREQVEVKTKDGRTKRMSQEDLFEQIREQTKGFKMVDGKLYREVEKTETKDSLDPSISSFLDLGVWAQQALQKLGWGWGKLNRLRSLTEERDGMLAALDQVAPYSLVIELGIIPQDNTNTQARANREQEHTDLYVLHIDYNRELYPTAPHFSLRQVLQQDQVLWTAPPDQPTPASTPARAPGRASGHGSFSLEQVYRELMDVYIRLSVHLLRGVGRKATGMSSKGEVLAVCMVLLVCTVLLLALLSTLLLFPLLAYWAAADNQEEGGEAKKNREKTQKVD